MGVQYQLVNLDKKESISFLNIDTGTKRRELAGTIVSSNIITWYMLQNIGDKISFINDTDSEQELFGITYKTNDFAQYTDVTLQVVNELIEAQILRDYGVEMIDEEENLSFQKLHNIWDPALDTAE